MAENSQYYNSTSFVEPAYDTRRVLNFLVIVVTPTALSAKFPCKFKINLNKSAVSKKAGYAIGNRKSNRNKQLMKRASKPQKTGHWNCDIPALLLGALVLKLQWAYYI